MLDHWMKCTGGDHRYVREVVDVDSELTEEDTKRWEKIYDEYIKRYGLSKLYSKILKVIQKKALLELKWIATRDAFLETRIRIEELKLEKLMKDNGKGMSIEKSLIKLSKQYPFMLRAKELTFIEYQNILEEYGRSSKA